MCPENFHEIDHFLAIGFLSIICPKNVCKFPMKSAFFCTKLSLKIPQNLTFFHDLPEALFITKCSSNCFKIFQVCKLLCQI